MSKMEKAYRLDTIANREYACMKLVSVSAGRKLRVADIHSVAKDYELSYTELLNAYNTYLTLNRVDLVNYAPGVALSDATNVMNKNISKNAKNKYSNRTSHPGTNYTPGQKRNLFIGCATAAGTIVDYLERNKIDGNIWHNIKMEIWKNGTIDDVPFLDLSKYKRVNPSILLKLFRLSETRVSQYYSNRKNNRSGGKWFINLVNDKELFRYIQTGKELGLNFRYPKTEEVLYNHYGLKSKKKNK